MTKKTVEAFLIAQRFLRMHAKVIHLFLETNGTRLFTSIFPYQFESVDQMVQGEWVLSAAGGQGQLDGCAEETLSEGSVRLLNHRMVAAELAFLADFGNFDFAMMMRGGGEAYQYHYESQLQFHRQFGLQ